MRGRRTVPTICGAITTFVIVIVGLLYATTKFVQLMSRANPLVSSFMKSSVLDASNVLNFREKGSRFAFGVEGFLDKELKDDSRYVKTMVRVVGNKNGKSYERILSYKKCTAEDFEEFAPPTSEASGLLEVYKTSETRRLYCLDWNELGDELAIYGG